MERIHKPSRRAWIDDNIISVQDYLNNFSHNLSYASNKNSFKNTVSEEVFQDIENECGLSTMRCIYQERVEPDDQIDIPEGVFLKTLKYQKDDLEKREKDSKYFSSHYASMKFTNYPPHKVLKVDLSKFEHLPVETPEVVLTVQIHAPERKLDPKVVNYAKMPSFHVDQEFLVLGCQYLTDLREKIDCISDKAFSEELSECPNFLPTETCKDLYKSGFFYINGYFYNDMRDENCRDYSDCIIKWSKKHEIGPFKKALMEKTRFIDLSIQLGYPYVYVHQGECEHLIVFTSLRLFSKHDVNNRNVYPMYTQVKPSKRIFCMVCHAFTAMWVVYDNKRLPENPFFFCKRCFFSFNYDSNDQKIGEFRAYYFPDRTRLF